MSINLILKKKVNKIIKLRYFSCSKMCFVEYVVIYIIIFAIIINEKSLEFFPRHYT